MRALKIPDGVESDPRATEMVRFWLANKKPHLSLLLGMYADAKGSECDERFAWGYILRDIAQHVANGLQKSHGWDFDESVLKIAEYFNEAITERSPGLEGDYAE